MKSPKLDIETEVTDLTNEVQRNNDDDVILHVPEISMIESRFDTGSKSKEPSVMQQSSSSSSNLRIMNSQSINMLNPYYDDISNDLGYTADLQNKPIGEVTLLSSTSLLHGNCIFNRNNTVATSCGLKNYWLCKSYRISMCKARCITHQGKIISATGVHNHLPHMSNNKMEIPPGYTPNNISSSSSAINEHFVGNSVNSHPSTIPNHAQNSPQQLNMMQQFLQHQQQMGVPDIHEPMHRSLQLSEGSSIGTKITINSLDKAENSNITHFKMEHI